MSTVIKKYCREVSRALPCSRDLKRKITDQITQSIQEFLNENPNAAYADIEAEFGSPMQIASAYLDEVDHEKLTSELKLKQRVVRIFAIAMTIALLMFAVMLAIVVQDDYSSDNGFVETQLGDTIIIED